MTFIITTHTHTYCDGFSEELIISELQVIGWRKWSYIWM